MKRLRVALVAALTASLTSPCIAASDRVEGQVLDRWTGAFAGMAIRMPLGSREKTLPTARLKLGMTQISHAPGSALPLRTSFEGSGLELGLLGREPMLFVGGQSTKSLKQRAQLNGDNTWLYVAGGLAVAAVAAFLIFVEDDTNAEPCVPGNC